MSEKYSDEQILELMNSSLGYNLGPTEPEDAYEDEYEDDCVSEWDEDDSDAEESPRCLCYEGDSPLCGGCEHQLRCFAVDCNYSEHYESDEDWRLHESVADVACPCESTEGNLCPDCYHLVTCEKGEGCSERGFHYPDESAVRAQILAKPQQGGFLPSELPARHKTYWTRLEDEQLVKLFKAGWDIPDIAAEHQRTVGSIANRLLMLSFDLNGVAIKHDPIESEKANEPWSQNDDDLVTVLQLNDSSLALLSAALKRSQREIALRLIYLRLVTTCDLDKVSYYPNAASNDAAKKNKRWTTSQYVEIREAFLQGASLARLAEISGRTMASCLMVLHSRGEISELDLEKAVGSAQSEISRLSS